jgi:hypothetical protein
MRWPISTLAIAFTAAALLFQTTETKADNITISADVSGCACSIADAGSATFTLYVIHSVTNGAVGAFLRVAESAGFTATFVEENIPYYHVGTFRDGVTVVYEQCIFSGPVLIGTITYQGMGTSQACSKLDTAGNPNPGAPPTPYPVSENCTFSDYPAPSTSPLYVNASSACSPPCLVRTESNTWGQVKSLYRR